LVSVDIKARTVKQWPKLGVHTKLKKHATTYLLDIPELLIVASEWDDEIRPVLPATDYWFAPISPDTLEVDPYAKTIGVHRTTRARKDLRRWLGRVGLQYKSPHQFRHGHAVYAIKQAQNVGDLKAVSQNLMHANLSITDGVYGILSESDIAERISSHGRHEASVDSLSRSELKALLTKVAAEL